MSHPDPLFDYENCEENDIEESGIDGIEGCYDKNGLFHEYMKEEGWYGPFEENK